MKKTLAKKAFKPVQHRHKKIDFKQHVSDDWLQQFIALCNPIKIINTTHLNQHIGANSAYRSKSELTNALQYHYVILSGILNETYPEFKLAPDQKSLIISKLVEEIDACTPGFHARVNSVLEGYFLPKTIQELFHNIRTDIIERTAAASGATGRAHNNNPLFGVHHNNRYFVVAEQMGYGVYAKLDNDPYSGIESDEQIKNKLAQAFAKEFQPFSTLRGIREIIISRFELYNGRNEEKGYVAQTYEPGLEYLKILFNEKKVNHDYLILNEDYLVIDINWDLVLHKLWNKLIKEKYFNFETWDKAIKFIPGFKRFVKTFLKNRPPYEEATTLVKQLFLEPKSLTQKDCKILCYLFLSEIESFAYLTCNPNLPIDTKLNIFIASLEHFSQKETLDLNIFWDFALENPTLTQVCSEYLAHEHAGHFFLALESMQRGALNQAFRIKNNRRPIQRMLLQLDYATPTALNKILNLGNCFGLALANCSYDINEQLLRLLKKLPHHQIHSIVHRQCMALAALKPTQITSDYWALLTTFNTEDLVNILQPSAPPSPSVFSLLMQNPHVGAANLHTLLGMLERLSDKHITYLLHPVIIHTALTHSPDHLMPLLQWMRQRPALDQAIYFKTYNGDSLLNLAAMHQPRLFPKLHQIVLGMDSVTQDAILAASQLQTLNPNSLEHLLLQLNQKVLKLQTHPARKKAFEAAIKLQTTLNQTLIDFYDKKLNAHEFKTLSNQAIQAAHQELSTYWEWEMILKNIALIIISIPTLGVPLLINYYHTGYKRLFFQSTILDTLDNLSNHTEKACDHDSNICFFV